MVCTYAFGCSDDGVAGDGDGSGGTTAADGTSADATGGNGGSAETNDEGSASGGGSAGDGGDSDSGGGSQCDDDRDCQDGECVALVEGGVRVCVFPVIDAMDCPDDPNGGRLPHKCCDSSECKVGICVSNDFGPQCSGAVLIPYNICVADECTVGEACAERQVCIPAGALAFPVATCIDVACVQDSDCDDAPSGTCVIEPSTTCCNDLLPRCRYPDTSPVSDECPP
jgi:hypothetical protein